IGDGPKSGDLFPVGTTMLTFVADDGVNPPVECSFDIIVTDVEAPVITCPNDITETIPADRETVVVNFEKPQFSDNCSSPTIEQTAGPASGSEFKVGTTEIEFTATDEFGNTETCSFTITVTQEDENLPPVFDNCPQDNILKKSDPGKCGAIVTFDFPTATDDGESVTVTRTDDGPKSGELFPVGTTTLTFEADDGINPFVECSFKITVEDHETPVIACQSDIVKTISAKQKSVVVEFEAPAFSDNCLATIEQTEGLPSGSEFPVGTTEIEYTVTDSADNTDSCSFNIVITHEKKEILEITCPENKTLTLNENCKVKLPDYTKMTQVNFENAKVEQSPLPGTLISNDATITLTASFNGETDSCEFSLNVIEETPEIKCLPNQTENYVSGTSFSLPDYRELVEVSGYCGTITKEQTPKPETPINENTFVIIAVTDDSGNVLKSCGFKVVLDEEGGFNISCPDDQTGNLNENCRFVIPDYREKAKVSNPDAVVTQAPKPGEAISQNTSIELTATLGNETASCSFQVVLKDTIAPTANCASEITVQLNENGIANLTAEDVDKGSGDNCGITSLEIDKTTFNQNDLGENLVTLTVTDAAENISSCTATVVVEPNGYNNDFACRESVVLKLEANGEVKLNPEDLFYGDGSDYTYSVNKKIFTCADLGKNSVIFSYSGPDVEGSCEIEVLVEDPKNYCDEGPGNPTGPGSGSFIIVYPNPGNGMVKIAVSNDISLTKAEVFDMRGRLLYLKEFVNNIHGDYKLDIRNVQSGVYLLKLYGVEKIYYERVIISTY
ncbi:MAG TPA: HYR domain-containing protein, partial [Salinimicrobium sp.]|nr:HYR domain-containing protein [Salinimicrobium sp.]